MDKVYIVTKKNPYGEDEIKACFLSEEKAKRYCSCYRDYYINTQLLKDDKEFTPGWSVVGKISSNGDFDECTDVRVEQYAIEEHRWYDRNYLSVKYDDKLAKQAIVISIIKKIANNGQNMIAERWRGNEVLRDLMEYANRRLPELLEYVDKEKTAKTLQEELTSCELWKNYLDGKRKS